MTTSQTPPSPHTDAPRHAVEGEALCPLCDYDLRGLAEPRCPECGYRFDWSDLRDPAKRIHPYLFEHDPERNVGSFLRTLVGGLAPRRFWSTLYPTQPSRPGRMVAYWFIAAWPMLVLGLIHLYMMAQAVVSNWWSWRGASPRAELLVRMTLDSDARSMGFGLLALACVAWPWATFAALLVFQASMRRARIRRVHVLRCVIYSSDAVLWLVPPVGLAMVLYWTSGGPWRPWGRGMPGFVYFASGILPFAAWLCLAARLAAAYGRYLRFDRPTLTVLCSQLIVALAYFKLVLMAKGF